jgi:hypothetical protein
MDPSSLLLAGGGSLTQSVDSRRAIHSYSFIMMLIFCRQVVKNAAHGVRSDARSMLPDTSFLQDVTEAEVILDKNGWLYR